MESCCLARSNGNLSRRWCEGRLCVVIVVHADSLACLRAAEYLMQRAGTLLPIREREEELVDGFQVIRGL